MISSFHRRASDSLLTDPPACTAPARLTTSRDHRACTTYRVNYLALVDISGQL